jgi:hypothetical protein
MSVRKRREWRYARLLTAFRNQDKLTKRGIRTILQGKKDGFYLIEKFDGEDEVPYIP